MWFVMNVTFVKISLSFFHLLKVVWVLKHYFSLFVKWSSSYHILEQFFSFFFITSWVDIIIIVNLVERFSLQLFHRVILIVYLYEVHWHSWITCLRIIYFLIFHLLPNFFQIVVIIFSSKRLIGLIRICKILYWDLPAHEFLIIPISSNRIYIYFISFFIKFRNWYFILIWYVPIFHFLIRLKTKFFSFLFRNNCEILFIKFIFFLWW